jgi:DNA-binding beta-propeller fold protein YncE
LLKLDPTTLKVLARVTPAPAPAHAPRPGSPAGAPAREPGLFAVYGVGVDDARDQLWVTNSRQNTVSVYRQDDLALVKQFAPETVAHPRDVVVDSALGKAYASSIGKPELVVFDTAGLRVAKTITIQALGRGKEFSPASLSLDAKAHRLYAVSLSTSEVAVVNTQTDTVEKVLPVPGARGAIGVSHDPQTGRIFVAAQGSDNLVVLDANGTVIADTPVGAGALNVVFDPVKRLAYVSNRGAGTIAVTDIDGRLVANLGPAPMANHVSLGKDGVVYAVDKSANARGEEGDTVLRIRPRR